MTILARFSVGRILLHLLAMLGDRCVRFHFEGIVRELPWITSTHRLALLGFSDASVIGPTGAQVVVVVASLA